MNEMLNTFKLQGTALAENCAYLLDEMAEHFVEHAEVTRTGDTVLMSGEHGNVVIERTDRRLDIQLACPSEQELQMVQNSIAEHMFYFAGEDPLELIWAQSGGGRREVPNLRQATVISAENVTPHMRRVKLITQDLAPFIGGAMHVRILVPPRGRAPIWPHYGVDGRLVWPKGEDELVVRPYTIRAVDEARGELWIDFLQHPKEGVATPGADFARDAQAGDVIGLIGPGSGSLPEADDILMVGDESALPAIARIAAEVPAGTRIKAIIEIENAAEEQDMPSAGQIELTWLHRETYAAGTMPLRDAATAAIEASSAETFMWIACEKEDVRAIKALLNARKHDRHRRYVAWYWER